MAISKLILNGVIQMDVTGDTVDAQFMVSGKTATKADGTKTTGSLTERSSSDLTVSGATVTVPAGVYSSQASKAVASGSATTPATSVTANPSISVSSSGLITSTASATKSVTPTVSAGYVSSGTAGTITVSGSNTSQLTTQGATTITPSTSSQTAVASGVYTTGAVTVAAMPSGTAGTPTATKGTVSNNSVSVTPSVTNTTGYITGSTKTGTAVTVSASELVSGTKSITENGTGIDVSTFALVNVNVPSSGSADLIVALSKDNQGNWTTDHTFSEIQTAYNSGKTIAVVGDIEGSDTIADGYFYDNGGGSAGFATAIAEYNYDSSAHESTIGYTQYEMYSDGTDYQYERTFYRTFDGNASASDVLAGKIFYNASGRQVGTGAGSATLVNKTITANGTYNASSDNADGYSSVTVNVAGGGGLIYETGTWIPSQDVALGTISFANTHTEAPFYYCIYDSTSTPAATNTENLVVSYTNFHQYFGSDVVYGSSHVYGIVVTRYRSSQTSTGGASIAITAPYTSTSDSYNYDSRYWAKETGFTAYTNSNARYWRANREYKWIAVWK